MTRGKNQNEGGGVALLVQWFYLVPGTAIPSRGAAEHDVATRVQVVTPHPTTVIYEARDREGVNQIRCGCQDSGSCDSVCQITILGHTGGLDTHFMFPSVSQSGLVLGAGSSVVPAWRITIIERWERRRLGTRRQGGHVAEGLGSEARDMTAANLRRMSPVI